MRARNSPKDCYCGVINVGDAPSLLKRVAQESQIPVEEDDATAESLFKGLDASDSSIAFLVGAKKFLEDWSSWRVSTMGLLKVGQNAGAQVLQLFGRGVRLKGWQFSLRRSTELNLTPQLGIGDKDGYHKTARGPSWGQLSEHALALLPIEDLYRHALAHKAWKDWGNLYLSRDRIKDFLRHSVYLSAPPEVMVPRSPAALRLLTQAARVLIEKGIDRFYLQCQRAEETRNAQLSLFDADHPNVPRIGEVRIAAYTERF